MKLLLGLTTVFAIGSAATGALAQPAGQPPPPPPPSGSTEPPASGYTEPPPPPPAGGSPGYTQPTYYEPPPAFGKPRGANTHDGFYLRMAIGGGYFNDSVSTNATFIGSGDITISGFTTAGEFLVGGTVANGFVIGGGLLTGVVIEPDVDLGGISAQSSGNLFFGMLGPFMDYYFDPNKGLHLQVMVGLGFLTGESSDSETAVGGGLAVGLGHDWWVSDEWSLGILGRLAFAAVKVDDSFINEEHKAVQAAALFTATYH